MSVEAKDLSVSFDGLRVLWNVSIHVVAGETVAVLGPNGSGKSTLMNSISGLVRPQAGRICFDGRQIQNEPAHKRLGLGIAHVLERHRLFAYMTVLENLVLGAGPRPDPARVRINLERAYTLFPRLAERKQQLARHMSGGEQQMCAIARGLMSDPRLLMVDEPFIGLSPHMREEVKSALHEVSTRGVSILLIEQNVKEALAMSDRVYVLRAGHVALTGACADLAGGEAVREVFMGAPSVASS